MIRRPKGRKFSSGIVMTAGLLLLTFVILFILLKTGVLTPQRRGEDDGVYDGTLYDMEAPEDVRMIYRDIRDREPLEVLEEITVPDRFVWNFRSVQAWGNDYTVTRFTITHQGNCYRIESDNLLVICDGKQVYRREGMIRTLTDAANTDIYREAGLTPPERIQNDARYERSTLDYDDPINVKSIRIRHYDGEVRNEYIVSLESGLAVTERSYIRNMAYRMILTDSFTRNTDFGEELFTIPEE